MSLNIGAYMCPGASVTVHEGRDEPWQGQIVAQSLSGATNYVSVIDPLDNPHVIPGEQRAVSWRDLRLLRRNRWSR